MLLDISKEVEVSGVVNAKGFSMSENSMKLFAMLSNFLYKDKERSVLTELSSNAIDAHKLVGKHSDPIHVTMPTMLVPEIRIRDFGPGLSEDDVYRFLTTYGESSKQSSNDFIGGFGIGSKIPAAVSDTWTINSHHEGTHKQYIVFITPEGVPSLTKMVEKPSTESGLEVIVPVKKDRINAWNDAARKAYATYDIIPKMHNCSFQLKPVEWVLNTKSFGTTNQRSITELGTSALINGRVYPLDLAKIDGLNKSNLQALAYVGGVFKFDIGELSLNLSREDLQYDAKTMKAVLAKVESAMEELRILWKGMVDDKSTSDFEYYVNACAMIVKWFENCNRSNYQMGDLYAELGKGCKHYSKAFDFMQKKLKFELGATDYDFRSLQSGGDKIIRKSRWSSFYSYSEPNQWNKNNGVLELNIQGVKDVVFLHDDGASYINIRVRENYLDKKINVLIANDFSFLPKFLQSQIVKSSSLPKPTIVKSARGTSQLQTEYYRVVRGHFEKADEQHFKTLANVAYVKFKNANTLTSIEPDFQQFMPYLEDCQMNIVGIKEGTAIPSWAAHPKDALLVKYNGLLKMYDESSRFNFFSNYRQYFEYYGKSARNATRTTQPSIWNKMLDLLSEPFKQDMNSYTSRQTMQRVESLAKLLQQQIPANKYNAVINEFKVTYPMISLLMDSHVTLTQSPNDAIIMGYVEMIGK